MGLVTQILALLELLYPISVVVLLVGEIEWFILILKMNSAMRRSYRNVVKGKAGI